MNDQFFGDTEIESLISDFMQKRDTSILCKEINSLTTREARKLATYCEYKSKTPFGPFNIACARKAQELELITNGYKSQAVCALLVYVDKIDEEGRDDDR